MIRVADVLQNIDRGLIKIKDDKDGKDQCNACSGQQED